MLHRCAFDACSSMALSAHPWNLPYHSRAILSRSLFCSYTKLLRSLPIWFLLLALSSADEGADSLSPSMTNLALPDVNGRIWSVQYSSTSFSMHHFLLNIFFRSLRKVEKENFRCARFSEWNEKLFKERKFYSKKWKYEKEEKHNMLSEKVF